MKEKKGAVQVGRLNTANQDNVFKNTIVIIRTRKHVVKWDTTILSEFMGGVVCVLVFFLAMYAVLKFKGVL